MRKYHLLAIFLLFFEITNAQLKVLYNFSGGLDGDVTYGSVTASGGRLFGMTCFGGADTIGVIFSIDTNGNGFKDLLSFDNTNGRTPAGSLTISGTKLYGMTLTNIFSIDSDGNNFKTILPFSDSTGKAPEGSLILSGKTLYGMTFEGVSASAGNVFCIDTDGTGYKDLHNFTGPDGDDPWGSLILSNGVLYGMTNGGGDSLNGGVVFRINTDGTGFNVIHYFDSASGKNPMGSLILNGNVLYGMTRYGGPKNDGVLFSLDTNGAGYKVLLDFNGTNGAEPIADLTLLGEKLYGMTSQGGTGKYGTIFSIDTDGTGYKQLFSFNGSMSDEPYGNLTLYGDKFYGLTTIEGSIFSFKDTSTVTGINQLLINKERVAIWPNPNNGEFSIQSGSSTKNSEVEIFNIMGERIYSGRINSEVTQLDISGQPAGLYLYRVMNEEGQLVSSGKVVVEK